MAKDIGISKDMANIEIVEKQASFDKQSGASIEPIKGPLFRSRLPSVALKIGMAMKEDSTPFFAFLLLFRPEGIISRSFSVYPWQTKGNGQLFRGSANYFLLSISTVTTSTE